MRKLMCNKVVPYIGWIHMALAALVASHSAAPAAVTFYVCAWFYSQLINQSLKNTFWRRRPTASLSEKDGELAPRHFPQFKWRSVSPLPCVFVCFCLCVRVCITLSCWCAPGLGLECLVTRECTECCLPLNAACLYQPQGATRVPRILPQWRFCGRRSASFPPSPLLSQSICVRHCCLGGREEGMTVSGDLRFQGKKRASKSGSHSVVVSETSDRSSCHCNRSLRPGGLFD
jgi:hypothetical protein